MRGASSLGNEAAFSDFEFSKLFFANVKNGQKWWTISNSSACRLITIISASCQSLTHVVQTECLYIPCQTYLGTWGETGWEKEVEVHQ